MDTLTIIGALVTVIGTMAGLFVFILKDERARNDRLVTKLDEQNKVVADSVAALKSAVTSVNEKQQLIDVLIKATNAVEALGTQRQVYEAIEKLHDATEMLGKLEKKGGKPSHWTGDER